MSQQLNPARLFHYRGPEAAPSLALAVMPAMPRLEAELLGLPPTLLAGEMVCATTFREAFCHALVAPPNGVLSVC